MIYLFLYVVIGFVFATLEHAYSTHPERYNPGFTILAWPGLLIAYISILLDHLIIKAAARCKF